MARRLVFGALVAVLGGTGCTESTPSAVHPPPKSSATLVASGDARPSLSDAAAALGSRSADPADAGEPLTVPEGKPTWRSTPKETNGFYPVLDGLCSKLGTGRVGKDVIVFYGGAPRSAFDTTQRSGLASFIALKDSGLESIGDPMISSPTGLAGISAEEFWIADSTGSRSSEGAILHRRTAGTWKTYAKDQTHIHAWLDGGVIGTLGMAASDGAVWVDGSSTKPPEALWDGLRFPVLSAFPSGEVTLLAQAGEWGQSPWIAKHWAPGKKITRHVLSMFDQASWPQMVEIAPDELYAWNKDVLAMYDGTSWRSLGKTTKRDDIAWAKRAAKGEVWVRLESGGIERSTASGFVVVPTPEPMAAIDGIDLGTAWGVGQSGKLYKRTAEAWTEVKLPGPSFGLATAVKAKDVLVATDDVLVKTAYWEKGLGWTEQELHWMLLRTKAPKETMRCNEPDPENNNVFMGRGFQSWPPVATAECKTPFVVLARRSKQKSAAPSPTDWKNIRAALKGKADLGDGKLVEFVSGDRTFLGAKAKDFESGKKIATLAAAKERLRPEVVCGEPAATTRELPLE